MKKLYNYLETIAQSKRRIFWLVLLSTMAIPVLVNLLFTSGALVPVLADQTYLLVLGTLIYAAWLGLLYLLKKRDRLHWKHLSLTKPDITRGLLAGMLVYVLVNAVLATIVLAGGRQLVFSKEFSTIAAFLSGLSIFALNIFVGAFIEEIINRVYLVPQAYKLFSVWVKNRFVSLLIAVGLTQVLFALLHLPADIFRFNLNGAALLNRQEDLFLSGILYAIIYLRTRNVVFVAIYHAFLNYNFTILHTDLPLTTIHNVVLLFMLIFWNKILKTEADVVDTKPVLVA